MAQEKEYFAFISYQRKDEKWAKWLAKELEHYHLPTTLNGKNLPKNLRPIFRDVDELSAGNLPEQIYHALSISKNLIVVCSPRSAKSEWVNKEIEDFINIKGGKADSIYPFIIEGVPFSMDAEKECFPRALKKLPESEERLGGNINEQGGRNAAVVKIIAGMLGIGFDTLWNKYEHEQRRRRTLFASLIGLVAIIAICIAGYIWNQNKLLKEKDWRMMENQARAVADRANRLIDEGNAYMAQVICLEVLPKNLLHPDRPYLPEVEDALRRACDCKMAAISLPLGHNAKSAAFSSDANKIAILYQSGDISSISGSGIGNHRIIIADTNTGAVIQELEKDTFGIDLNDEYLVEHYGKLSFCNGDRYIISGGSPVIRVWDVASGKLVYRIIEEQEAMDSLRYCFPTISVSPDGKYFAVSRKNGRGIKKDLRIYEAKTGKQFKLCSWDTNEISFSPDGKSIIAVFEDGNIKEQGVINKDGTTNLTKITKPDDMDIILFGYHMASFKTYNTYHEYYLPLLDDGSNPPITIRDVRTGNILNIMMGHSKPLSSLSISKDGKTLVSASWDKTIKIWKIETGELLRSIDMNTNPPYFVYCSADGRKLAIASDSHFNLYSFRQTEDDRTVWGKSRKVLLGKDTNILFVSANDSILVYNTKSGVKKFIFHCPTVEIENEDSLFRIMGIKDHCGGIANFSISPNCQQIATYTHDGVLRIVDVATHKVIQQKRLGNLGKIRYGKDGKSFLSISYGKPPVNENDDTLRIWDTASWKLLHTINSSRISDASFLLDGNSIAYMTYNDFVIQNLQTGEKQVRERIFHSMGLSLSCSPDGKYFATCSLDGIIRVYDMKTLTQLYSIANKLGYFRDYDVQFSPDSKSIVAATEKGIDVWDAETGVRIYHIPVDLPTESKVIQSKEGWTQYKDYDITGVSFSPDGRNILWSIKDSIVKMTPFPSLQLLINETRERFKARKLTPEERRKYYLE